MKRFTFLMVGVLMSFLANSQAVRVDLVDMTDLNKAQKVASPLTGSQNVIMGNNSGNLAASGDTIQYFDFNSSTGWTVQNSGTSRGWQIGSDNPWYFGTQGIASTSGASWAALKPGQPSSVGGTYANYSLTSPAVNCSGKGAVFLTFEQRHARFYDTASVWISNDGTNFTKVYDNLWLTLTSQQSGSHPTANPMKVTLNVTGIAGNSATVYVRFNWSPLNSPGNGNTGIGYGWYVDDVMLLEGADHDLKMDEAFIRLPYSDSAYWNYAEFYSKIPLGQANTTSFQPAGKFSNVGGAVQSGAGFDVTVAGPNSYSANYSSVTSTLNTKSTDSASLTSSFKLSGGVGQYTIDLHTVSDSTLEGLQDDTISYAIEVTDSVYARDRTNPATTNNGLNWVSGGQRVWKYEHGMTFELTSADAIKGVQIFMPSTNDSANKNSAEIMCHVYNHGGYSNQQGFGNFPATAPIFSSTAFKLNSNNTGKWINVPVTPVTGVKVGDTVKAGFYVVTVQADQKFAQDLVYFGVDNQNSFRPNNFLRTDQVGSGWSAWSFRSETFYIRLLTKSNACPSLNGTASGTPTTSCGLSNGSATATNPTNGTAPYSFKWDVNGTQFPGQTQNNLKSGVYTVTITDGNGCTQIETATVSDAGAPTISGPNVTDVTCAGNAQGAISFNIVAGNAGPGYSINWFDGKGSPIAGGDSSLTGLEAGTYTVKITDGSTPPCLQTRSFIVGGSKDTLKVRPMQADNVSCNGKTDGRVTYASASGGTGAGTYSFEWWDGNKTNTVRSGLAAGSYAITVTDQNNCTASLTATVTEPTPISIGFLPPTTGTNSVTITANVGGGAPNYTYDWRNQKGDKCSASSNVLVVGPSANGTAGIQDGNGKYTLNVTDANNCINSKEYTVEEAFLSPLSVSSITEDYSVSVYPNPSNGLFNLNMTNVKAGDYSIEVKNVVGQSVYNNVVSVNGTYNGVVSLDKVETGVYFMTITSNGNENTLRLIVE